MSLWVEEHCSKTVLLVQAVGVYAAVFTAGILMGILLR